MTEQELSNLTNLMNNLYEGNWQSRLYREGDATIWNEIGEAYVETPTAMWIDRDSIELVISVSDNTPVQDVVDTLDQLKYPYKEQSAPRSRIYSFIIDVPSYERETFITRLGPVLSLVEKVNDES